MYQSYSYRPQYVHIEATPQKEQYRHLGDIMLSYGSGQHVWLTIQEAYETLNAIEGAIQKFHAMDTPPQLSKED